MNSIHAQQLSKRAPRRNEVKSRIDDNTYFGLEQYRMMRGGISESQAIAELLNRQLFGTIGIVPTTLVSEGQQVAHIRTEIAA